MDLFLNVSCSIRLLASSSLFEFLQLFSPCFRYASARVISLLSSKVHKRYPLVLHVFRLFAIKKCEKKKSSVVTKLQHKLSTSPPVLFRNKSFGLCFSLTPKVLPGRKTFQSFCFVLGRERPFLTIFYIGREPRTTHVCSD